MTTAATEYVHQGNHTATLVSTYRDTITLAVGRDTPNGYRSVIAMLSATDAKHLADNLRRAAQQATEVEPLDGRGSE